MTDKVDLSVSYMVSPKEDDQSIDIIKLINSTVDYVQNHEIYFLYNPGFVHNVLTFTIIGFKSDHDQLMTDLGKIINELKCNIQSIREVEHVK